MSLSNSTLEPAEAVPRRVERDTYSVADVRKALCYLLAHVEKGDAPPTPWAVAHKLLGMPAMYYPVRACVFTLLPRAKHVLARAIHASGPAPTRVLNRSFPTITPALLAQLKAAWEGIEKLPVEARRAAIAVYEPPRKGGAKSSINIFSDDEEEILVSFCNIALEGTFGVSKEFVHELMCDILRTPGRAHSSRNMTVSMSTVKTWMRANGVKKFKSNSIDPARVAKATEHVRDAWFARVDRCAALAAAASVQQPRPCSRRVRAAAMSVHATSPLPH